MINVFTHLLGNVHISRFRKKTNLAYNFDDLAQKPMTLIALAFLLHQKPKFLTITQFQRYINYEIVMLIKYFQEHLLGLSTYYFSLICMEFEGLL